ncbi:HAD family hydrolase [Acutalibacter sp.]|uniref:HAD family hydrolase n=1 Tax=Acutalibacter sp. TaxID=1918636 RepID=UPI00216CEA47|nr:HAD-IIB family hydrolase [Acutalibacter sp.]
MEKTLYVSDLDGTLLNRQSRLSPFTQQALNRLLEKGMLFTFATARSWRSARVAAQGLSPFLPWIIRNGAAFANGQTGVRTGEAFFTHAQREEILRRCAGLGLWPLVYSMRHGEEKVSYLDSAPRHQGMAHYIASRQGDKRLTPVDSLQALLQDEAYYFRFIHTKEALVPLWKELKDLPWLNLTFQQELYRQEYWLEITSEQATKAQAALRLKQELGCARLVAFGDAMNDLPLFRAAEESYATANAMPQVKAAATAVIGSNEEDGVARFLLERFGEVLV